MNDQIFDLDPGQLRNTLGDRTPLEVTLHEQQLRVSTRVVPFERVRIERFIVTEQRTLTVDIRREEVRIVRERISEAETGVDAPSNLQEHPREDLVMILSEEQAVITKRIVPVERVRLHTHVVTELQEVVEELGREHIDVVHTMDV
ncbi:YsnF/AvaK domain-containing protein [Cryobacterium sp. PH31-O1]|uniref:YsnF/AvaK domain-containing protein n=1 Tax=Cryobacterium sp. PH31-O1 TaxID=3046306 RepID=UPI0024B89EE1|nr:YsnF/AvaK domain-containing protein [Cryobacterium sp. PH31-O1]MDJ0337920.1 YsnF/AvaK domain-containing protein [Cryobacterium sp. PH31-O1]